VNLRQLKQRVALRCELRPLTEAETLAYLAGRLRAAGGVASRIFTREAAMMLHQRSGGIPRLINVLADNALLAGFGKNQPQVTSQLIAEIAGDFHLTQPGDGAAEAPVTLAPPPASEATQTTLLTRAEAQEPEEVAETAPPDISPALSGTFSARRRFPFLGRRGTA